MKKFKFTKIMCLLLVSSIGFSGCASSSKSYPVQEAPIGVNSTSTESKSEESLNIEVQSETVSYDLNIENSENYYKDGDSNTDDIGEGYLKINENKETETLETPVLTFSLKIDTSSYGNVSRYINSGNLPPVDAVKTEEMVNYFNYDEILKENDTPFSIYTEIGKSPFDENKNLAFIRVKSKDIEKSKLPKSNLTFLIDTSGSMDSYDKLPLLKSAFELLVETLNENDVVSIVTYAGSSSIVLDSVNGDQKSKIIKAINNLQAGGSTAGADGIVTAYKLAEKNFIKDGNNRVILASDGDFNVGLSSLSELEDLISSKRDSSVYLSILGFGTGNIQDDTMETLSKNGNGNYSYIDSVSAGKKVLVDELASNLFTIADDVKTQVEFNPNLVSSYRLIGYENRQLENKDFEDDKKDAGEIGIGTDVVLMFELQLNNVENKTGLKYQETKETKETVKAENKYTDELFEVRVRYKNPEESESLLITQPVKTDSILEKNTSDFKFATSVVGFAHLLRDSENKGDITFSDILENAKDSLGKDKGGYRAEFITLLKAYNKIK